MFAGPLQIVSVLLCDGQPRTFHHPNPELPETFSPRIRGEPADPYAAVSACLAITRAGRVMPPREDYRELYRATFSCHNAAPPFDSEREIPTLLDGQPNILDHAPR